MCDFSCIYNYFVERVTLQNLLTFAGLTLAYLAYTKLIEDKYDSWKALLQSFLDELDYMKHWIGGEYKENDYDKNFFNPAKRVFNLTTVSAEEIVRRGINDISVVEKKLRSRIALFIERIAAFNAAIEHNSRIISANPVLSQKLRVLLEPLGLFNSDVTTTSFEQNINSDKKFIDTDEYLLMQQIFKSNKTIHQELIGNMKQDDKLGFLYDFLVKEIKKVIIDLDNKNSLPSYIKHKKLIILAGTILYFILEYYLI